MDAGEDSSSSQNSTDVNGGVFRECRDSGNDWPNLSNRSTCIILTGICYAISAPREGAGVTPGLRRRRERAERQKSFMREQQEAVASGYRFGSADESDNGKARDFVFLGGVLQFIICVLCYPL